MHDLCKRYIKVKDFWLQPRTSLSVRCSQHVGILYLCNLGLFIFLSFGQDVISKSEPTDHNKGLGVSRFGCGTMSMLMTCTQLVGYFQSCFTDSLSCLVHGR